jgi:hypothetical protein
MALVPLTANDYVFKMFRNEGRARFPALSRSHPLTQARCESRSDPERCVIVSKSLRENTRKKALLAALRMRSSGCDFETFPPHFLAKVRVRCRLLLT